MKPTKTDKVNPFMYYIVDARNPSSPEYWRFPYPAKLMAIEDMKDEFRGLVGLTVMKGTQIILNKIPPTYLELRLPTKKVDNEVFNKLHLNRMKRSTEPIGETKLEREHYWKKVKRKAIKTLKSL